MKFDDKPAKIEKVTAEEIAEFYKNKFQPNINCKQAKQYIRLNYVSLLKFNTDISTKYMVIYAITTPFAIPKNTNMSDAINLLSHVCKEFSKREIEPIKSPTTIEFVNNNLHKYGFTKVEGYAYGSVKYVTNQISPSNFMETNDSITELFFVEGDFDLFNQTHLSSKYFDWYNPFTTPKDISKIYMKIANISLPNAKSN